jgi:uncharacterized protein YodC (DUF2158 family)
MSHEFAVGDKVQLKSGGPIMTISETAKPRLMCVWFVENKRVEHYFEPLTLVKAPDTLEGIRVEFVNPKDSGKKTTER